jgi:ADP-ribosylglycohydrolase
MSMSSRSDLNRALGSLLGLAFGDAMGRPTEFLTFEQIRRRWPPSGPTDLVGQPARVTDDTQMTIAVGEALVHTLKETSLNPADFERALRKDFVNWLRSPDNNRAPGRTCITACERLADGATWLDATVVQSKGCGANMRVAPAAFVHEDVRAPIAQFQAALTHGHPTALAASDLTAFGIATVADGTHPDLLVSVLRQYAESQRTTYHSEWLGRLWSSAGASDPKSYISTGWNECLDALANVEKAARELAEDEDPCTATGDGWIAEEAFATAVLCFLLHRDQPRRVVCRAAATRGDSDSIACIAGALVGARLEISAWPEPWIDQIEYGEQIGRIARDLVAVA